MNIHEYQAARTLSKYGVSIPKGDWHTVQKMQRSCYRARRRFMGSKAQIHSGARGKAGGIIVCKSEQEVSDAAKNFLVKH